MCIVELICLFNQQGKMKLVLIKECKDKGKTGNDFSL